MEITDITQRRIRRSLPEPFDPSWVPGGTQPDLTVDLFEVHTDEGVTGHTAMPSFPGGLDLEPVFESQLVGEDPHEVERILDLLETVEFLGADAYYMEIALWDIIGKTAGKPVYSLLGGDDRPVPVYASTGSIRPTEERLEYVQNRVDEGFEAVKLRFTADDVASDLDLARAVREAFPDLTLMVDANNGWSMRLAGETGGSWSLPQAKRVAGELEDVGGVAWLEEPLGQNNYRRLAELRASTSIAIAGGESVSGLHTLREYVAHDALDILQPDAVFATGILNGKKAAGMAEAFGLGFAPHTWSNGLGLVANLHLLAATHAEWCEYPHEPPGFVPEARDFMLKEPVLPDDGAIAPPDAPGLGLDIDWDAVEDAEV
ncbi:MAG: mandelate racemase/muconate lactonizing enzyme family protein [Halobacteriales archaeon]